MNLIEFDVRSIRDKLNERFLLNSMSEKLDNFLESMDCEGNLISFKRSLSVFC